MYLNCTYFTHTALHWHCAGYKYFTPFLNWFNIFLFQCERTTDLFIEGHFYFRFKHFLNISSFYIYHTKNLHPKRPFLHSYEILALLFLGHSFMNHFYDKTLKAHSFMNRLCINANILKALIFHEVGLQQHLLCYGEVSRYFNFQTLWLWFSNEKPN